MHATASARAAKDDSWFHADSPAVRVETWQRDEARRCYERARHAGLRLPPKIRIVWFRGPTAWQGWSAPVRGEIVMGLDTRVVKLRAFRQLCFHELAHCADHFSGQRFTPDQLEARATAFAARMVHGGL